ncbi:class A beta-lactamase-related serine hydrolase [Actinomadura sp. KC345]|uniref:serine hydrolase domain-containing protein n=1 Tax=Actinomadura sp. KC345 TaxID=2530371 RepID=UPI00104B0B4C|nr:serine hydrolase domain-containing protein [Actinomadura sp. KC345]TDC46767.1 class A beta-lactamase-related serine hydrolase [Actinomadura sp. KC345]
MTLLPDLQEWIDRAAERHGVPGAAVAVGVGARLAEAATGVINLDTGVEATADSLFQIGSVTKVWTAALVMQLAEEGLVDLDEPVRRYLPEFGVLDAAASESITVRQLLSHTGGFDGDLFEDTGRGDDAVARFVAFMRGSARQVSGPGELFSYCNAGYCALGALVAGLRGRTWETAMRELLIEPLGARHMALYAEEAIMFRAAVGHVGEPPRVSPRRELPQSNAPAGSTPSAAPRDLVRFGRMLLADGAAADGTQVLPSGTFAEMCRPQVTLPPLGERYTSAWGLGLMLFDWDGRPVVGHDGGTPGQTTAWRIVPDRDLVLAVHANGGRAPAFIDEVLARILSSAAGLRLPPRALPPDAPVPFWPETYTGRYSARSVTYEVKAAPRGLDITDTPQGPAARFGKGGTTTRYVHAGGGRFVGVAPDEGVHPLIAFLQNGRFLYTTRTVPRVQD